MAPFVFVRDRPRSIRDISLTQEKAVYRQDLVSDLKFGSRGRIRSAGHEILVNHRRQSQQSRLELGLRRSRGFSRANNLDC